MKLERIESWATSFGESVASAITRFLQLDRRIRYGALLATGALIVGLAAMADGMWASRSGGGISIADPNAVDFRVLPPAGFKGTLHSRTSARMDNGLGGCTQEEETKYEVLSVASDSATVKFLTSTDYNFWGATIPNPRADLNRNRLCIQTVDRNGKVLKSEGESPDEFTGGQWPDHPVKIGESWTDNGEGQGVNAGTRVKTINTLREVVTIKGRRMAVLDCRLSGDVSGTGTVWVDLRTGLTVKGTGEVSGRDGAGWPITSTVSTWFVDESGDRWLD
jgi:hypothetical protein